MDPRIEADALEYGLHVRGGDWRLGLLVARSVEKGKAGRPPKNSRIREISKVSIVAFARKAGVGEERIRNHMAMWSKAAEAGLVPAADTLDPGDGDKIELPGPEIAKEYYTSVSGGFNGGKDRTPTVSALIDSTDKLSAEDRAQLATALVAQPEVREAISQSGPMAIEQHLELATQVFKDARDESERKSKEQFPSHAARSAADELGIANRHAQRALAEVIQWNVTIRDDRLLLLHGALGDLEHTTEQIRDLVGEPSEVE
jgi:hypothetical protein